jgi:hypothetical protein
LVALYLIGAWIFGWWPFETRTSGSLPLSAYEDVDVNAYFYYPSGAEIYLGRMRGASACGDAAYSFASSKNLNRQSDWSYICCTIRRGSDCYEKIR